MGREETLLQIRELILTPGRLESGFRTSERDIAKLLDVSRPVIREALAVLEQLGVVQQLPNVGVHVRLITIEEVREILRIRSGLEGAVVQELVGNRANDGKLREIATNMRQADAHEFMKQDTLFHCEMARLAGFDSSLAFINGLRDRLHVFRLRNMTPPTPDEMADIVREHVAIMDALRESSDATPAVQALQEHLQATESRLARILPKKRVIVSDEQGGRSTEEQAIAAPAEPVATMVAGAAAGYGSSIRKTHMDAVTHSASKSSITRRS